MSLDQLVALLHLYWPYVAGALVIGVVAGWFSYSARERSP